MSLHRGHLDSEDPLRLRRQRLDHISLQPSQHDVLELGVKLLDLLLLIGVVEVEVVDELD